jgi:hypothetical protein
MLRRLFPWLGTIESYSLEPAARRDGDNLTNCGRKCVGKSQEPVPNRFELRFVFGKLYVIGGSEVHRRLFEQESDRNMQFGCRALKFMHYSN